MESFFSLFDPSEGCENKPNKRNKDLENIKKNADAPKGRRRRRKSKVKNATLPEESSFLCEPDLSNELLVKDCSYIESYIELNKQDDKDTKNELDRKPKRRNSGRKNRRRKTKISPPKEGFELDVPEMLNNTVYVERDDKMKNIKLIQNDFKKEKRKENRDNELSDEEPKFGVFNVMDKLERVRIENDMYLSGDFNAEDLESDLFHGYDEDDYCDDDSGDADDSGDEIYGNLPPEPRFGNVEYKLQLVQPCERRFQHLVTQLKWRLRSGGGNAIYVVGVRDCGALRGLRARALRASLRALRDMARALGAHIVAARARRLTSSRAVAEVYIRKLADTQQSVELRVAVLGANEAGKSTLIGVLTQGELDNGRGSARLNMFRHLHEVKSGRTSSLSHEILGFDAQGNVVNYGCSELMTAERIGERSAKLVSFLDLAGHSKYQRTTLHGLTGYCPHYAIVVISATAGITKITEEHIGLLLALDLPFFTVINKCELAPNAVQPLVARLGQILDAANKKPLLITDENLARSCVAPQKSILDTIDKDNIDDIKEDVEENRPCGTVAVFPVSCVRGAGLNALHACLLALSPAADAPAHTADESCEFQIDEIFHVGDSTGPVVGGLLARGQLQEGDNLIIGPLYSGEFVKISVKTIYRNRVPCGRVRAGQSASLGLGAPHPPLRPGMVLLSRPDHSARAPPPAFPPCRGDCQVTKLDIDKNNKNKKNKNILQDIANGNRHIANPNRQNAKYESHVCECKDRVLLEDPNDPRGCIYFQATVRLLRHSTAICPGFQCSVHVGNVRQTAIIEGIMSASSELRAGETAPVVFRFARCPEYLVRGRRLLFTAGLGTRAIGRVTQTFPYVPDN